MFLIGQSYGLRLRSTLLRRPFSLVHQFLSPLRGPLATPFSRHPPTSIVSLPLSSVSPAPSHLRHLLCFVPLPNVAIIKSIRYTYDRIRREFKYRFGIRVREPGEELRDARILRGNSEISGDWIIIEFRVSCSNFLRHSSSTGANKR